MSRVNVSVLLDKKIRSRDGLLVGRVRGVEIDLASLHVTGLETEASRDLLDRLNLGGPSITGGRMVMIAASDVDRIEADILLKVDALDLAKLRFGKVDSII
jgi:sporulation protein YlmC with PRC-barrel domain